MNSIVTTNRGGICCICQDKFHDQDEQITHVGGEGHDGFHKKCLATWVTRKSTCPYDQQPIDRSSLITQTDLIIAKLRPALTNAAYAACFGTVGAIVGTAAIEIPGVPEAQRIEVAALAGSLVAVVAATTVTFAGTVGTAIAVITIPTIAAPIIAIAAPELVLDARVRALGLGTIGVGGGVGIGIEWILNRRAIGYIDRQNIGFGMLTGTLAGLVSMVFNPLALYPTIALVGSIATGIVSLINRD